MTMQPSHAGNPTGIHRPHLACQKPKRAMRRGAVLDSGGILYVQGTLKRPNRMSHVQVK